MVIHLLITFLTIFITFLLIKGLHFFIQRKDGIILDRPRSQNIWSVKKIETHLPKVTFLILALVLGTWILLNRLEDINFGDTHFFQLMMILILMSTNYCMIWLGRND